MVDAIDSFCQKENANIELIIVNDGSSTGVSAEKLAFIKEKVPQFKSVEYGENKGKGYALRKGVEQASYDIVIYTDIDFPYTEESLVRVFAGLKNGHEVVLGHRGKDYYNNTPWFRKVVSKFLRWILKTFLRLPTDDSQCGLKGFNKKGAEVFCDTHINRFLFDMEFIKLAAKRKLNMVTVDAELKPEVVFSKVHPGILLREVLNFFKVLFRK